MGAFGESLKDVQIFTPRWAADEMIDLLGDKICQRDFVFFEPTCGRGDIVIALLDRISAIHGSEYAIQNVFGIDIDPKMIEICRGRVHVWCLQNGVGVNFYKNIDLNFRAQDFFECFSKNEIEMRLV